MPGSLIVSVLDDPARLDMMVFCFMLILAPFESVSVALPACARLSELCMFHCVFGSVMSEVATVPVLYA